MLVLPLLSCMQAPLAVPMTAAAAAPAATIPNGNQNICLVFIAILIHI